MKFHYQFGYDIFGYVLWRTVSPEKFQAAVAPLILEVGQEDILPKELMPIFNGAFVLRDGSRLYRAVERT